jgi:hypothetical protein
LIKIKSRDKSILLTGVVEMTELTAMDIAHRLKATMPGIGFCSKSKRINAFLKTVQMADEMADDDVDLVVEAIGALTLISKRFNRALVMVVECLNQLSRVLFSESAWIIANTTAIKEGYPTHRYYRHLAKLA